MSSSNFTFVQNKILRRNLDETFDHILILLPFLESNTYNEPAKSAFRKTIIIHTASIIEALLFHILDTRLSEEDLTDYVWKLKDKKVLHVIDDTHQIVAGDFQKEGKPFDKRKLNLGQISSILKDKKILEKSLYKKVDEIRILRNGQHIGPDTDIKEYVKEDLEKAFAVASEVKVFTEKKIVS